MAVRKGKPSGLLQSEFDELCREQELIRLSVEIEMRQTNINKMSAILAKAKDTLREAQKRVDYEHKRLMQAQERMKELEQDGR
jgi:hypothetical protein